MRTGETRMTNKKNMPRLNNPFPLLKLLSKLNIPPPKLFSLKIVRSICVRSSARHPKIAFATLRHLSRRSARSRRRMASSAVCFVRWQMPSPSTNPIPMTKSVSYSGI
jgi:hypothetical protein